MELTRRTTLVAAGATALGLAACSPPNSGAGGGGGAAPSGAGDAPAKPSKAVELNVVDVAGNLQLTQGMLDEFVAKNSSVVSKINTSKAQAPELPGKLKVQQQANRVDIDLVLTGTDALSAGQSQGIWLDLKAMQAKLPGMNNYLDDAAPMQKLAGDYGVMITYYPSGPLLEYMPNKVAKPPTTADELMEWCRVNPSRFQYARPANSGPGRTWLMGLPYILGDSDPMDPEKGWEKTWKYLADMSKYVPNYPTGTTETMKNLASGTVDMIISTTGWDINPRVIGTVPKEAKIGTLKNFAWVTDAHYACVPKGVTADKLSAIKLLLDWILTPEQNAKAYDEAYFYPGPAVKGATLDKAPQKSQDAIKSFGRPEYEELIASAPKKVPLDPEKMVKAFERWDKEVGGAKVKK